MISQAMSKIDTNQVSKQDLKHQWYDQIHVILVMCIVVKGTITLTKDADREFIYVRNRFLAFKNNAPFKINVLIAYQISILY